MKNIILYKVIKMLIMLMGRLPASVLTFFSNLSGLIWFKLDKRHRTVVFNNIQTAYPGKYSKPQAWLFVKKNFQHTAGIFFEVIWSYALKKEELITHIDIKGKEHIDSALKKGRGVVLLGCHMGNFELMSGAMAKADIRPIGLYRKMDFEPLERLMLEMRQRFGTRMLSLRKAAPKITKALENGEVVATLLDQNVDWYKGTFVDYFGQPACTNNGLAKLILRTKACVVPMFIMKQDGRYIHEFLPEVCVTVTHDPIKDIENNTQAFVSAIESMVRRCPEQYFWVHNRWKTKPYCLLSKN
ncbi:MAG: lysophospholipid acyltransferase family protein [Pseudomonadota bacterium]